MANFIQARLSLESRVSEHVPGEDCRKEYANLLNIPQEIIFPLELSIHLKDRLQIALEEIFRLKKQLYNQDYEANTQNLKAEKSKSDKYFETKEYNRIAMTRTNSQMATKVVELSKRIRDMTADQESMKTRMKQLMAENDALRSQTSPTKQDGNQSMDAEKSQKSEEDLMLTAQQLANTTNKMMDYRRQTQQLRIELRSALKALSQEVGDGTTPQIVLNAVSNASWRGRQQQILALQQKVAELQNKISQNIQQQNSSAPHNGGGEPGRATTDCYSSDSALDIHDDNGSIKSSTSHLTTTSTITQKRMQGLQQQEKNKREQLEKLSAELENAKKELKSAMLATKASKARAETLEEQVRNQRSQIEVLEGKLGAKQMEAQELLKDITHLNQELDIVKDRMRAMRDTASSELRTTHQALQQERSQNARLQKQVDEYEQKVNSYTEDIQGLQLNLAAYAQVPPDELEARKKLKYLELQYEEMKQGMMASESESQRLLQVMEESMGKVEEERSHHSNTQRHLLKCFVVLDEADRCIDLCLDKGHINDKKVLECIENLKSMRRELKTGDLFHVEPINITDTRKLKSRITILSKEIEVLQNSLKASAGDRKKDLQNFASIVETTRKEFFMAFNNSVVAKQINAASRLPDAPKSN